MLYAVHDALVKAMPGQPMAPSLAESWAHRVTVRVRVRLRKGVKFHNGEPVTAEDAKFSFERYRGRRHPSSRPASPRSRWSTLNGYASGSSSRGRTS